MKVNLLLLILVGLLGVPTYLTLQAERGSFTEIDDIPRLFEGFNKDVVAYVAVSRAKPPPAEAPKPGEPPQPNRDQLVFQRVGDGEWVLANTELRGVPVRATKVEDEVLENLRRIRRDEKAVVEAEPSEEDLRDRYQLAEENGYLIQALDAQQKPIAELIVGKDTSDGTWAPDRVKGRFVRARNTKSVLVYEVQYWQNSVQVDDWIDPRVHELDVAKVTRFKLMNPKGMVEFEKDRPEATEWKLVSGPGGLGAIRHREVDALVQRFAYLNVVRYLGPVEPQRLPALGLQPAEYEVTVGVEDGTVYQLWIGKKIADKAEYNGRSNHSQFLFTVGDWLVTAYEKDPKDLFDPPASAVTGRDGNPPGREEQPAPPDPETAVQNDFNELNALVTVFTTQNGRLPTGWDELTKADEKTNLRLLPAPLKDPWGREYSFEPTEGSFEFALVSSGPDGEKGTEDDIRLTSSGRSPAPRGQPKRDG